MVRTHDGILDRFIETDSQTGKYHLSLKTCTETFVKRGNSFLSSHGFDTMEHAVILGFFALDLKSDFGRIEWDGKDLNLGAKYTSAMLPAIPPVSIMTPRGRLFGEYWLVDMEYFSAMMSNYDNYITEDLKYL